MLQEAAIDIQAFTTPRRRCGGQIGSSNPQEHLNRTILRCRGVAGIFPNRKAIIRLIGAVLAKHSDEWRRDMCVGALEKARTRASYNRNVANLQTEEKSAFAEHRVA